MSIHELVNESTSRLVEVPLTDWLTVLKAATGISNDVHKRWHSDLLLGAENAAGNQFVTIERAQAAAMCKYSPVSQISKDAAE